MSQVQHHIVKQLVVELALEEQRQSNHWQDIALDIARNQLPLLLDRYLSQHGDPHRHYRIDSLEIDLGSLSAERFSLEYCQKLETVLSEKLASILTQENSNHYQTDALQDAYALLSTLLLQGHLPWWEAHPNKQTISSNIDQLLAASNYSHALAEKIAKSSDAIDRLLGYCNDEQMAKWVCAALPFKPSALMESTLSQLVKEMQRQKGLTVNPARLRRCYWRCALVTTLEPSSSAVSYFINTLKALHRELNIDLSLALELLGDQFVSKQTQEESGLSNNEIIRQASETLITQLRTLKESVTDITLLEFIAAIVKRLRYPSPSRDRDIAAIYHYYCRLQQYIANLNGSQYRADSEQTQHDSSQRWPGDLSRAHQALLSSIESWLGSTGTAVPKTDVPAPKAPAPKESGGLYLQNAGIVIFWPFLQAFFNKLDLLTETEEGRPQFKDHECQSRAALLLHYLATAQTQCQDHLCFLNKLMTGMEPKAALLPGMVLNEQEQQCCEELITAAIAHIPSLKNSAPEEFRHSFLQRTARLEEEQGVWTLRVEKENQDLLLDHIPWSIAWIKLPWMKHPLQVIW